MCGINGFIAKREGSIQGLKTEISAMNDLIFHRGPDDHGAYAEVIDGYSVAMGMRRLSIIDLHSGDQPIYSDDGQIIIVYNGEIYNFLDLKKDLQKQGVTFSTQSDTEVILKLYEQGGEESFKLLDGMFAFSIYDKKRKKVFIARDFFGEKPLYYTFLNEELTWSSELKSLVNKQNHKPIISHTGLNLYFKLTYIPAPYTIYEDIYKLEPNHYLCFDLASGDYSINPIDEEESAKNDPSEISFSEATKNVEKLVYNSVASRSISDVPLGTFLSGGVDSSIVSLCLSQYKESPIETFSIGFEKKSFDESSKSRIVAELINSNHHEFIINENHLKEDVHEILLNFDEPFADSSSLPTYIVAKKTRDFVKVALTGDGGDEVFGGYNKYYVGKMNNKYVGIVPKGLHQIIQSGSKPFLRVSNDKRGKRYKIKRLLDSIDYNGQFYWDIISLGFVGKDLEAILLPSYLQEEIFDFYKKKSGIYKPTSLTEFRQIDRLISLEGDMLVKVDRTSMLNSLECRAPFLNKKIWRYTNTLPESYLLNGWNKKYILKEAFKDQFPEGFLDKSKGGFGAPVGDWLRSSFKEELELYISEEKLHEQNIFNVPSITKLVRNHLLGKEDNTFKVWTYFCFQKWYFNTYLNL